MKQSLLQTIFWQLGDIAQALNVELHQRDATLSSAEEGCIQVEMGSPWRLIYYLIFDNTGKLVKCLRKKYITSAYHPKPIVWTKDLNLTKKSNGHWALQG